MQLRLSPLFFSINANSGALHRSIIVVVVAPPDLDVAQACSRWLQNLHAVQPDH